MFEGLKSTIGRLGNKVANIAAGGLKLGQKAVGTVSHYGHKFVDPIQHGLDSVSKIPFVGKMVAPVLAPVAGVVGTASSALQVLDGASGMMGRGAKGIRGRVTPSTSRGTPPSPPSVGRRSARKAPIPPTQSKTPDAV